MEVKSFTHVQHNSCMCNIIDDIIELCYPNDVIFGAKCMEFPATLWFITTFVTYSYSTLILI